MALAPMFRGWSLEDARLWLLKRVYAPGGETCPLCHQHAQVYARQINSGMVRMMQRFYEAGGTDRWVDVRDIEKLRSGEYALLRFWGLLQKLDDIEVGEVGPGGPHRSGVWKVTPKGERFLFRLETVPQYVNVYDNRNIGAPYGDPWSVMDALGSKFDWWELMGLERPRTDDDD